MEENELLRQCIAWGRSAEDTDNRYPEMMIVEWMTVLLRIIRCTITSLRYHFCLFVLLVLSFWFFTLCLFILSCTFNVTLVWFDVNHSVGGAVASWARLQMEQAAFRSLPGTLCWGLGQDTLLSVSLSIKVYKGVPANLIVERQSCEGPALIPPSEGVEILLVASCYRNRD